jgi:methylphosphotriester-DNA--protein-cysteine methyltransferase
MMKRFANLVLVSSAGLIAFIYTKAVAGHGKYVVPANSNKYHYPSCRWARKFRAENLAVFPSAKDALGAGYVPCKVCKPPGKD